MTLFIAGIIFLALLIPTAYAGLIGAPFAPTRRTAVRQALKAINLNQADTLIDLGCGAGDVLIEAQKLGAKTIGYELSPIMWLISKVRARKSRIILGNFLSKKLPPETTTIFLFMMPDKMEKMRRYILDQDLPNLKHILVYIFPFPDKQPQKIIHEPKSGKIYIYSLDDTN